MPAATAHVRNTNKYLAPGGADIAIYMQAWRKTFGHPARYMAPLLNRLHEGVGVQYVVVHTLSVSIAQYKTNTFVMLIDTST